MESYYKTSDGKVVELEQQIGLYLYFKNIVELIILEGCKYVNCENNQLTELIIPDGCKCVRADMKSITVLNKVDILIFII